ncbi:MAG: hypothetical protein V3T29_10355 [Alphaproteobacteria bacterium]
MITGRGLSRAGKRIVEGLEEVLADHRGERKLSARPVRVPEDAAVDDDRKPGAPKADR